MTTRLFERDMKRIGASEADIDALFDMLKANPEAGDRIVGLAGARKVRFALPSRKIGKSGGGRAKCFIVTGDQQLLLTTAYLKKEQGDLSPAQRKTIMALLEDFNE